MAKTYEVEDNTNPKNTQQYPYEVVEIDEDGSNSLALFTNEKDAYGFVAYKEEEE